jgi:UDP-N-acetylglucosamine--N-acetylmuramyl-(pentapeptide) pyrophosphoryl-undecaprenol N-acetylglucosamine transferase
VAAALAELDPGCRIFFIGTRRGLESRVVPQHRYPIDFISIGGFLGKGPSAKARFPFLLALSIFQSLGHLRRQRPQAVLGTGGYVCAPPVLAARLLGIPAYLLALDAMPSRAVRMLARHARTIFAGFPECADHLAHPEKVVYTGNPLRGDLNRYSRKEGLSEFGLDPGKKTVLVYGGSQGAHSINEALAGAIAARRQDGKGLQIIWQTGEKDYGRAREIGENSPVLIRPWPYIEKMALAFAASDLVISRSGSTVSEILACGLPSILVPYPYAASNHQEYNARSLERGGAAEVILDADLEPRLLWERISSILVDQDKYQKMKKAAQNLARPNAAREIAGKILEASD